MLVKPGPSVLAEGMSLAVLLLICQPGGPDLGNEQQHVIDKMYRYIEKRTGLEKGQMQGFYTNDREKCLEGLEKKPTVVMPSPLPRVQG
jgi:hypothetical protein